jgi:hypothetical protein
MPTLHLFPTFVNALHLLPQESGDGAVASIYPAVGQRVGLENAGQLAQYMSSHSKPVLISLDKSQQT